MKFEVKLASDGKYQITGVKGYVLKMDNRFDAEKHCNYLNRNEEHLNKFREQNIQYYTKLTQIKMLAEQIQRDSSEIHILELAIRIKDLIRGIL